ncbi:hypothetical protein OQI_38530 [Streptomyces pharetrae CZA14]|uniref:Uncharacterized protein n=1 Tax=Streptomyces pharetrae CZA14 TaxID=1144883 RepID=A0ABX3Y7M2_9ACTN|nr:hypothetical protein OQI_38530 [Streptomyces pharetrae CZA14]
MAECSPGPRDLPVFADAWGDDRGRLVRARTSVNMSGTRVTVTTALPDIGEPVRVTVLRAPDTVPVTEVGGIPNGCAPARMAVGQGRG